MHQLVRDVPEEPFRDVPRYFSIYFFKNFERLLTLFKPNKKRRRTFCIVRRVTRSPCRYSWKADRRRNIRRCRCNAARRNSRSSHSKSVSLRGNFWRTLGLLTRTNCLEPSTDTSVRRENINSSAVIYIR